MTILSRLAAVSLALVLAGTSYARDTPKLDVVASFSVLGDFAARVGGDRVAVTTLVGPGADAHAYEPTPIDAARVAEADVVIVNGAKFEGFIDRLVEASGTKASIVTTTRGIELMEAGEHHDEHADGHGEHDPHAWHSIAHARRYVANIADGLCTADPDGCGTYRTNAEAYTEELTALEEEVRRTLGSLAQSKRTMIVSHDAFGYLAKAYGLRFLAPQGVSTESEASAADVARLIDQIREGGAAAVFVENIADPRLIERIAAETGLRMGGKLYSDALSPPSGPAGTYSDMMRHNANTIAGAVNGT